MSHKFITENYGGEYAADVHTKEKEGKKTQDAHEAIRPTDINRIPSEI